MALGHLTAGRRKVGEMRAEHPVGGRQVIVGVLSRRDEDPHRSVQGRVFELEAGRVSITEKSGGEDRSSDIGGEDGVFEVGGLAERREDRSFDTSGEERAFDTDGERWNDGGGSKRDGDGAPRWFMEISENTNKT